MELKKQLIHMEKEYPSVSSEFVIEEDLIIPDTKPDIRKILLFQSELILNENRIQDQKVIVNGTFRFSVLYSPEKDESALNAINGEIPFDEQIQIDALSASDSVNVAACVEDLNVRIINSRKCNLHALVRLTAVKTELVDISLPLPPEDDEDNDFITKCRPVTYLELAALKKDICRVRDEIKLPDNFPCIENLLWSSIRLGDLEIIPAAEKLSFTCNIQAFFIYVGEGEERPIRYYETSIPFSTALECSESQPGMIPEIKYQLNQSSVDLRTNSDGELRTLCVEQVLDLSIKLFEEKSATILDDIYHCKKDCNLSRQQVSLDMLCEHKCCKQMVEGSYMTSMVSGSVLQLIYPSCQLVTDTPKFTPEGIEVCGSLQVQSLYLRSDDAAPFDCFATTIPFRHFIEYNRACEHPAACITITLDKVNIASLSDNKAEIKAYLDYDILVTASKQEDLITEINCQSLDPDKMQEIPGIIIYYVKPGDTLWDLAKEYYVPAETILSDNDLSGPNLEPGQQLLIMR